MLIDSIGTNPFENKQLRKIQAPIWDRRADYRDFEDLIDYLKNAFKLNSCGFS